jgi:hypothetical protein
MHLIEKFKNSMPINDSFKEILLIDTKHLQSLQLSILSDAHDIVISRKTFFR